MYFEWKKQAFRTPPELTGKDSQAEVAVVGAGPVGLAVALGLAHKGVRVVVLEARDQVSDGSRALSLERRSVQLLDRLGVGEAFARLAQTRNLNRVFHGTQLVYEMSFPTPKGEKRPNMMVLQQCWTEQMLLDALKDQPTAQVRWHSRVTGVREEGDVAVVGVETPEGPYELRVPYVVATDGARSEIRRQMGLAYEAPMGTQVSERQFIIVDFTLEADLPPGRRLFLDLPYKRGSMAILHSQPFGVLRLDYPVEDGDDIEHEQRPETVEKRVAQHLAMMQIDAPWKILWQSVYRPRGRTLANFRHGRLIFAGDSAHQTPIFGGRGLNLGFGDAANLAWRLAYVVKGRAHPRMLDDYSRERHKVTVDTLRTLENSTLFMTRPSPGMQLMGEAVAALAPNEPFVRDLFDAHRMPRCETYETAAVAGVRGQGESIGKPIVDAELQEASAAGRTCHLHDLLGKDFTALYFSQRGDIPAPTWASLTAIERAGGAVKLLVIAREAGGNRTVNAFDPSGQAFERLRAQEGTLVLVRPDAYVAGRWEGVDPKKVERTLADILALEGPAS